MKAVIVIIWPWVMVIAAAALVAYLAATARKRAVGPDCFGDYPNGDCNECPAQTKIRCMSRRPR